MTLGISLALTLGAGLYADSGPTVLKRRFEAAWGKTEVFVANATPWELARERAWQHAESWSIRFAQNLQSPYGLRLEGGSRYPYGDMRQHRRNISAAWGDVHQTKGRHVIPYTDLGACRKSMQAAYWLTQTVTARQVLGYDVTDVDPVAKRLTASWSILDDARLQAVVNSPELVWRGQRIRIVEATLSCDEESPVWIARVEITAITDFAAIGIGDTITLALGLESFVLVVDGKTLSRTSVAEQRMELTAVSPVALLDAPFAGAIRYYDAGAVTARAAVEFLIGPVDWQLPDWIIPAGRLMLEGATPLAAARNIVAAIGGIVESNPDGSVVCRRRHPMSIPQYGTTFVDHSLFDADVMSAQAQIAPMRGYNRVTLANDEGGVSASADRIEYVADADDAYRGTVRAYLDTVRAVVLAHTGHSATVIATLGETMRTEIETVEFIEGRASTRYPVTVIVDLAWQHTGLGDVTAAGQNLTAATAGYSLLRITYTTTSFDWRVALPVDEEVQFVLVDA
ncbi:hypothetical protein [Propionivibrio sp.]|uniref:hypothetical protein n=1 Tax=Propionivibrio sp. TaxID=2212460 RepID=UPI00261E179A|nr:hypothetical protein [Propionivibrio sp.]